MYEHAYLKQDIDVLRRGVYPYKVNALHYFVLQKNKQAIQFCNKIGVRF